MDAARSHLPVPIEIREILLGYLRSLYGEAEARGILAEIETLLAGRIVLKAAEEKWSEQDTLLITYAGTLRSDKSALATLRDFFKAQLRDSIRTIHILPFFPYSSDYGFSVIDYLVVNEDVGEWSDIDKLAEDVRLMFDVVINHASSESQWFRNFLAGKDPGRGYFITVEEGADLSQVTRPRSSPLLTEIKSEKGNQKVWTTFSADQVDLDFRNPQVLLEFIGIILYYLSHGCQYIRLDAIGYLWKEPGTSCIHLPETHIMVKLLRKVIELVNPSAVLVTETNVPNRENLSYFGNRNEAHIIYNFSLPPLLLHALIRGTAEHLRTWMMSMPPAPFGCTYLNFTASHDGIGLRPLEGLLAKDEVDLLLETLQEFGGLITTRSQPDGADSPYEINISLFDALQGTFTGKDDFQIERFLCSQVVMMSLEGIPAFYIHSFLATPNDHEGVKQSGKNRAINRRTWQIDEVDALLADESSNTAKVLNELTRLIKVRRKQEAFHPNATQYTLQLGRALFGFWRQSLLRDQSIFSIHNLSDRPQEISLSDLNLVGTDEWKDLISDQMFPDIYAVIQLQAYQSLWLTNKF